MPSQDGSGSGSATPGSRGAGCGDSSAAITVPVQQHRRDEMRRSRQCDGIADGDEHPGLPVAGEHQPVLQTRTDYVLPTAVPGRSPTRRGSGADERRADRLCRRRDSPHSMGYEEHILQDVHAMLDPLPLPPCTSGHRMPARRGAGGAPLPVSTAGAGARMTPGPGSAPVARWRSAG